MNSDEIAEGIGKAFAGAAIGFVVFFLLFKHPALSAAGGVVCGLIYAVVVMPWALRSALLGAAAAACFYYGDGEAYNGLVVAAGWVLALLCFWSWQTRQSA